MTLDAAPDRESGRRAIVALCAAFEQDLSYYKSNEFDETSARQRFIDPFFAALGWDVADRARRGPYADVLLEYRLRGETGPHMTTISRVSRGRAYDGRTTAFASTENGSSSWRRSVLRSTSPPPGRSSRSSPTAGQRERWSPS